MHRRACSQASKAKIPFACSLRQSLLYLHSHSLTICHLSATPSAKWKLLRSFPFLCVSFCFVLFFRPAGGVGGAAVRRQAYICRTGPLAAIFAQSLTLLGKQSRCEMLNVNRNSIEIRWPEIWNLEIGIWDSVQWKSLAAEVNNLSYNSRAALAEHLQRCRDICAHILYLLWYICICILNKSRSLTSSLTDCLIAAQVSQANWLD